MEVAKTIAEIRRFATLAHKQARDIGLVPTMGALHRGHTSLIDIARQDCDRVVVSIFVNPTQFGQDEDFNKYPRPIDADLDICEKHGVDAVFAPPVEQMYPTPNLTWVAVEKLTDPLCGRSRPGHFRGVTTVCTKLFNIVQPHFAYFGQKDAQQAIVIKQMVADLNMPLEIVVCPIVRDDDGLAVSSRNKYLSDQERADATSLYKGLQKACELIHSGVTDAQQILADLKTIIEAPPSISLEYANIVNFRTLEDLANVEGRVLIAIAARAGSTRLIDNILVDVSDQADTMGVGS